MKLVSTTLTWGRSLIDGLGLAWEAPDPEGAGSRDRFSLLL